jgi:hypothetical protein
MSFQTIIKTKQNRLLSKTWRTTLEAREIERNNFHATGNLHQARIFAYAAKAYRPTMVPETEPTVIFSRAFL